MQYLASNGKVWGVFWKYKTLSIFYICRETCISLSKHTRPLWENGSQLYFLGSGTVQAPRYGKWYQNLRIQILVRVYNVCVRFTRRSGPVVWSKCHLDGRNAWVSIHCFSSLGQLPALLIWPCLVPFKHFGSEYGIIRDDYVINPGAEALSPCVAMWCYQKYRIKLPFSSTRK